MEEKKSRKVTEEDFHYNDEVNLRTILEQAIRMQAMVSGRRIRIVETSTSSN